MKKTMLTVMFYIIVVLTGFGQTGLPDTATYLGGIKKELQAVWPNNRTVNIVFHGHSVPAGYWADHKVHTLESYPHLVLEKLKTRYPYSPINVIVTAIGGENAVKGQVRFDEDVIRKKPDIILIDYALNDRSAGLVRAKEAWEKMIQEAVRQNIKVILLTPSPDQRVNISTHGNELEQHASQIRHLAEKCQTGLADPFFFSVKLVTKAKLLT